MSINCMYPTVCIPSPITKINHPANTIALPFKAHVGSSVDAKPNVSIVLMC